MSIPTVHEREANNTEEQQDDTVGSIMAEKDFNKKLVRATRTVALKRLSKTSVLVAANAKGPVQLDTCP